jgi:gamma-glutamyltranspeptidase / glutathione hydrolase
LIVVRGTEAISERGVLACGHPQEVEAGLRMLEDGGNAVDAVVAAAFTGFVVEPASCGLGGYGHMAVFLAERGDLVSVDHYVRAPALAKPDMFEVDEAEPATYYGWPQVRDRRNEWGAIAVAVPGAVAGLCAAQERFGRLPREQVLAPAIEAAEAGVPVTWELVLAITARMEQIEALPAAAALLLPAGRPPSLPEDGAASVMGAERIDVAGLARTLREIADKGASAFYAGPVAESVVREVRAGGGILSAKDLVDYAPRVSVEQGGRYRGRRYSTAGDPLGYEVLHILGQFDLSVLSSESWEFRHLMAEALGHAFADNMQHYGDPTIGPSPAAGLASERFGAVRAADIRVDRAASRPIAAGDPWPFAGVAQPHEVTHASAAGLDGTSHMAAVDSQGNVAALITALTSDFGSLVFVPDWGFFLNNAMRNFDPRTDRANSIAPGKTPIFAVPAIAAERRGVGVFAAAGAGEYRIASGVLHAFVNHIDFGMPIQAAVDAPRVHCQGAESFVDNRISDDVQTRLAEIGHLVVSQDETRASLPFGRVGAVARDEATGELSAGASPGSNTAVGAL